MTRSPVDDTAPAVRARQDSLLAALTPAERLHRALALSALARDFAWAGARRFAAGGGRASVRGRFLQQVYGADVAAWVAARQAAETSR